MISILIPNRLEPKIHEVIESLEKQIPGCQVIVAVDRDSRGKGWAIRTALAHAKYDMICFLDGDMDIHPRMIKRLIPFLYDYDIVVGKKNLPRIPSRRIISLLSRILIKFLFDIGVDTQTGIKLFRRSALPKWDTNGWMFDLEILAKANKQGKSMIEIPINANIRKGMRGSSIVKSLLETIKLWWEL